MIGRPEPIVCLVTDRRRLRPAARTRRDEMRALEEQLDAAIEAGVDLIQIRERDLEAGALRGLAGWAVSRADGRPVRILVNDRADAALVSGASGVHLRADGPPVERVRALGPPSWIIGRAIHAVAEAAVHASADYLLFGTIFPSESKPAGSPTSGLEALRTAARISGAPILAIGGIDPGNAAACVSAGANGIAAIGAFLPEGSAPGALGVARAVQALRAALATVRLHRNGRSAWLRELLRGSK